MSYKYNIGYMGKWYELGRSSDIPYETTCTGSTATYTPLDNERFTVENICFNGDTIFQKISGTAKITNDQNIFDVKFSEYQTGKYIILWTDYNKYSIVGTSRYNYLWILSRHPNIPDLDYLFLCKKVKELGYDPSKIKLNHLHK